MTHHFCSECGEPFCLREGIIITPNLMCAECDREAERDWRESEWQRLLEHATHDRE